MYCIVFQQLTGQKATPDHAADLLNKKFTTPGPRKETIVMLADEVCFIHGLYIIINFIWNFIDTTELKRNYKL